MAVRPIATIQQQKSAATCLEVDWKGVKRWRNAFSPMCYRVLANSREVVYKRLVGRVDGPAIIYTNFQVQWKPLASRVLNSKYVVFKK